MIKAGPKEIVPAIRFNGFDEKWVESQLGKQLEISSASRVHKEEWTKEGVPFFRTSDVVAQSKGTENSKAFISPELYKKLSAKSGAVEKGDLLVTGGGSIGIAYLINSNDPLYFKDADLLWLKNRSGINGYYLYTFFVSQPFRKYVNSISHVGTISHYTIEQAKVTPINVSTPEEQTKIGEYFQQLDALIAGHRKKREKLLQIKKSLLKKMFPKRGQDKPEIRFSDFNGEWNCTEFEKLISRVGNACDDPILPRVEYEDIVAGRGLLNKNLDKKESTKTGIEFQIGDVLYGKLRPYLKNWLLPDFNGVAVGDFWVLRTNEFNRELIFYLVQTDSFEKVANQSAGSKMPRADWRLVSNSRFSVPKDSQEQTKIGQLFKLTDTLINQHQSQIDKLNNIKQACIEQMFV